MKHLIKIFSILLLLTTALIKGQVLNSDFEQWVGATPSNWQTSNVTLIALPINKTTESHSGSFAAKGEVTTSVDGELFIPVLTSVPSPEAFPSPRKINFMNLYYKFNSVGGDKMVVGVTCFAGNDLVGNGGLVIESSNSTFVSANIPIEYFGQGIPDKCIVIIGAGHEDEEIGGHEGTYFIVDDITFDGTTDLNDELNKQPNEFTLEQNYPNTFNPTTNISYSLKNNGLVNLTVYDVLGNIVTELVNEFQQAGTYMVKFNAENLSSGLYFYKLTSRNFSQTNKMLLVK